MFGFGKKQPRDDFDKTLDYIEENMLAPGNKIDLASEATLKGHEDGTGLSCRVRLKNGRYTTFTLTPQQYETARRRSQQ